MSCQILCNAMIWLDEKHVSNTYCMLDTGHTGEHSAEHSIAPASAQAPAPLTKEQLLEKYGPYLKDDARSSRGF